MAIEQQTKTDIIKSLENINGEGTLKANETWGENMKYKDENTCRIYFQNIRNLIIDDEWQSWTDIVDKMNTYSVDIFGFVEPNVNWTPKLNAEAAKIGRRINKNRFIMQTSSSEEFSSSLSKRGGTLLCTTQKMTGRFTNKSSDQTGLGRWTTTSITGRNQRMIIIICLYRVSQEYSRGDGTSYMQQIRLLKQQGITNPNPRQQVLDDLDTLLSQWSDDKHDIILMMDANSNLQDGSLTKVINKHKLNDALGNRHGHTQPATYARGTRTIDYIFCSERIVDSIVRGGMLPYNEIIQSDHRALFIDIDINKALKGTIDIRDKKTTIHLTTKNKKMCKEYRELVSSGIQQYNLIERLDRIINEYKGGNFDSNEYQEWDRELTTLMTESAKKFKQRETVWWSPELHHAYLGVKFWKVKITQKQTNINMKAQIEKIKEGLPDDYDLQYGKPGRTLIGFLRLAKKHLRMCRRNSKKLRKAFQKRRIIETFETGNKKLNKSIRAIMYAEEASKMYTVLKHYLRPQSKKSLTYLDIYKNKSFEKRVVIKEEVNKLLLQEHQNHFRQAENTPCCAKDVKEEILKMIKNEKKRFKLGYRVDDTTNQLLTMLERKKNDPIEINEEISIKNIIQGFKIWKETTSTSPSERILPLYKVWIKAEATEKQISEEQFFGMVQKVIWLAIETGKPPTRWLTVHNMYIPKDEGSYKLGRLRPLHKLEADLNLVRREMSAKRLISSVEDQQYLSDENYGGRNNRSAIDVVLKKVFTITTYHLTRTNAAITDCDAKACYDRILPHLMALVNMKAGMPKKVAILFMNILQEMKYHISTGFGISKEANTNSNENPIYGIGQGATDGPAQWTMMSDILQKIHNKRAIGTTITNPTKSITESRSLDMFVDDASMLHTSDNKRATKNELRNIVAHDITSWNGSLHSSGGKLCGEKTLCYIIQWCFTNEGIPKIKECNDATDKQVEIVNPETHQNIPIHEIKPTTAIRMLGVHIAGNLQNDTEYEKMYEKALKFTNAIQACPLSKSQVILAIKTIYKPAIEYALPATTFNNTQIQNIHKKVIPKMLSSCNLSKKYPRALVFGPMDLGGLGFPNIEYLQTATKLNQIIKNLRGRTSLGTTFRIMMEQAQIQAGIDEQLLATTKIVNYIESNWIVSLIENMQKIQAQLTIEDYWLPSTKRKNDRMIMAEVIKLNMTIHETRQINNCRLFLKVTTFADICSSDGKTIMRQYKSCSEKTAPSLRRRSCMEWPIQNNPGKETWKLWRATITKITYSVGDRLVEPLGQWSNNNDFDKLYDSESNTVLIYDTLQWNKYTVVDSGRRYKKLGERIGNGIPRRTYTPITDMTKEATFTIQDNIKEKTQQGYDTFEQHITQLPKWQRQLIFQADKRANSEFRIALNMGRTIWICSDGGVYMNKGYFGWIATTDSKRMTTHKGTVTGNEDMMESHRTEACGTLAALLFIYHFAAYHNTRTPTIQHYCDNKVVVDRINWFLTKPTDTISRVLLPNSDIHMQIEHLLQASNFNYTITHVKGHQKLTPKSSYESRLNIKADELATEAQAKQKLRKTTEAHILYPAAIAHLTIQKQLITKKLYKTILHTCSTPEIEQHMIIRNEWTTNILHEIFWEPLKKTLTTLPMTQHLFVARFMHQRLPCKGEHFIHLPNKLCPCCKKEEESQLHFEQCTSNKTPYMDLLTKVYRIGKKKNINSALLTLLTRHYQGKKNNEVTLTKEEPSTNWANYRRLIKSQKQIGWSKINRGFFTKEWDQAQWKYERANKFSEQHDTLWLRPIIRQIFIYFKKRWKSRNDEEHDITRQQEKLNLLQRVKWLYSQKHKLNVNDRHPFEEKVETWEEKPVRVIKTWIERNATYIRKMIKNQEEREKKSLQDMRQFVTVTPKINKRKNKDWDKNDAKTCRKLNIEKPTKHQKSITKYVSGSNGRGNDLKSENTSSVYYCNKIKNNKDKRRRKSNNIALSHQQQQRELNIQTALTAYFRTPKRQKRENNKNNKHLLSKFSLPRPPENQNKLS